MDNINTDARDILTFIGLMRRAGALAIGAENAREAIFARKARLVFLAADAARGARDAITSALSETDGTADALPYSKGEIGSALGVGECAALAVLDTGFALALAQRLGLEDRIEGLRARQAREKRRKSKKRAPGGSGKSKGEHL
jgi:ribosomal protein L7Ae-like RNA K-turn-binding protein